VALVRERTIPTEQPQLVGEVVSTFADRGVAYRTILLLNHITTDNSGAINKPSYPQTLHNFHYLSSSHSSYSPLSSATCMNHQPTYYLTQVDALENLTMALLIQCVTHSPEASVRAIRMTKRLDPTHGYVGQTKIPVWLASSFVSSSSIHPSNLSRLIQPSITSVILHTFLFHYYR
jgi:hypothetical protein